MLMMMAHVGLHENLNNVLWTEYTETATKLKNIIVNPHKENMRAR